MVLSTGTYLDSQRFRVHLGKRFGVDPGHVEAQVIGDHGTSQVFLWSSARIGGVPVAALLARRGERIDELRHQLERDVRYANIAIIEGHDASQYGIGIVSARIAEMVLNDERAMVPIGSYQKKFGVTLSLPDRSSRAGNVGRRTRGPAQECGGPQQGAPTRADQADGKGGVRLTTFFAPTPFPLLDGRRSAPRSLRRPWFRGPFQ